MAYLEDEYYFLYNLYQIFRLEIDNNHVFRKISKLKHKQLIRITKIFDFRFMFYLITTDGNTLSAPVSTEYKIRLRCDVDGGIGILPFRSDSDELLSSLEPI